MYMTCSLLVLQIFAILRLDHAYLRKIQDSPCFSVLQATESWVGPGNETRSDLMD